MLGKKKAKLFGNHIEVKCEYCENYMVAEGKNVCRLNRSVRPDGSCPCFSYDPLLRAPNNTPFLRSHDAEEFKL